MAVFYRQILFILFSFNLLSNETNHDLRVPFPHPIGLHVSGSHHPKSVFFG